MNKLPLFMVTALVLTGCQGDANYTKLIQEALGVVIMAALAYSAGVLALGYLTDIKWVKRQAEERQQGLIWTLVLTILAMYFESDINTLIERATNLFNIK